MAVTLTETRNRVRRRLEDTTGTPLWADAIVDEGIRTALDDYSTYRPVEATATWVANAGDTSAGEQQGTLDIVQVIDPNGHVIPRKAGDGVRYVGADEQTWDRFNWMIRFTRPLIAGTYTVWYTKAHTLPAAAGDNMTPQDTDISLIVAGAVVYCIEQRLTAEWKRGELPARYGQSLAAARAAYDAAWASRRRRVRVTRAAADG